MRIGLLCCALCRVEPLPPGPSVLTIAVGGDVMFGRMVEGQYRPHDGRAALAAWKPVLTAADLSLVNLETGVYAQAAALLAGRRPLDVRGLVTPPDVRSLW